MRKTAAGRWLRTRYVTACRLLTARIEIVGSEAEMIRMQNSIGAHEVLPTLAQRKRQNSIVARSALDKVPRQVAIASRPTSPIGRGDGEADRSRGMSRNLFEGHGFSCRGGSRTARNDCAIAENLRARTIAARAGNFSTIWSSLRVVRERPLPGQIDT